MGLTKKPTQWPLIMAAALALGAGSGRPAAAQDIKINPASMTAILNATAGQSRPRVSPAATSSTGFALGFFSPINAAEFPFTVTNAGAYSLTLEYATPDTNPAVVVDIRKAGTEQHIATSDVSFTTTNDWSAFANQTVAGFSAPLSAGDYILRVQNITGTRFTLAEGHGVASKGVNFGSFTLARTGALPTMGTLSGTVNSDLGFPVAGAMVMAVAPGQEVAEPGPFWYHGYWTYTDAAGKYALSVPTGSYVVQAGRPDSYEIAGAKTGSVSVSAAGTTAPALQLTARKDFNGAYTVESEYYFRKNPDSLEDDSTGIALSGKDVASNGYELGWIDPGNWVDLNVDVTTSGWYDVTSYYFNGCGDPGIMRYTTDKGSSTQDAQPPTSWTTQGSVTFAKPIYLYRGRNIIRQYSVTGCSDMDSFVLTPSTNAPGDVLRLEFEAYSNSGGGSAASPTGGSSGLVIDTSGGTTTGKDNQTVSGGVVGFWSSFGQTSFDVPGVGGTYDAPEYLELTLDAGQDGLYSAKVRGAFVGLDQPDVLRIWNLSYGTIVDEPFTITNELSGGYDASAMNQFALPNAVPLKAGPNRLRVYLFGGLNADYLEFTRTGPLTGMGTVTGTVTANGQPVVNAQVSSAATVTPDTTPVALGTRAVTDAQGAYSLLLPTGAQTIQSDALGFSAAPTSVTVGASPITKDFTLTASNKYEGEWWTNAWQSGSPSGHGLSAIDVADASQGQTVGYFDINLGATSEKEFIEYAVAAPTAGVYNLTLRYKTDALTPTDGIPLLIQVPATGANVAVTVPKSDTLTDFVVPVGIPMTQGTNTLRFVNNSSVKGSLDLDYFTVASSGQGLANLKGTLTNADDQTAVNGASISVTSGTTVVATATTGAAGTYSFSLPAGAYTVAVSAPGYQAATKPATLTAGQTTTVDFSMIRGRLHGTIKDANGQPVANTAVIVSDPSGFAIIATTDAAGTFNTVAGLGRNTVLADVPLTITTPAFVDVTTDTTATFTVQPLSGGTPVPLNYDQDFFTTEDEALQGATFHTVSGPFSLPAGEAPGFGAASFPAPVTLSGINFLAPDTTGNANNVVSLVPPNNTITMPAGASNYSAAILALTCDSGRVLGVATLNYTDGTSSKFRFYDPEWFAGRTNAKFGPDEEDSNGTLTNIVNAYELFRFSHRHLYTDNTGDGDASGKYEFRFYSEVLPLDPAKTLASITLPADADLSGTNPFIWAVTLAGKTTPPVKLAGRALKIAAGLEPAPASGSADFTAMNIAGGTTIDILDAIALSKQGK